jgi:hypothetical protein
MIRTIHGTIRVRTIELRDDIGLRDGQYVEVQVTRVFATA